MQREKEIISTSPSDSVLLGKYGSKYDLQFASTVKEFSSDDNYHGLNLIDQQQFEAIQSEIARSYKDGIWDIPDKTIESPFFLKLNSKSIHVFFPAPKSTPLHERYHCTINEYGEAVVDIDEYKRERTEVRPRRTLNPRTGHYNRMSYLIL